MNFYFVLSAGVLAVFFIQGNRCNPPKGPRSAAGYLGVGRNWRLRTKDWRRKKRLFLNSLGGV